MKDIEKRLRRGMQAKGIATEGQEEIVRAITSFALYGFPESHAASFALIVYASAYLKCHHPTAFYAGLLNAWPLGFYHPATLVKDAQRAGVEVHSVDVNRSGWRCRWEKGGIRLGLRWIHGLKKAVGGRIEEQQDVRPFTDPTDLARRCRLSPADLERLAHVGALGSFGLSRRKALWQVAEVSGRNTPLFENLAPEEDSPLEEMQAIEETMADYSGLNLTTGPHLMHYFRPELDRRGVTPTARLRDCRDGQQVTVAGAVIVRQRPGTAKGFVFLTMEDEGGTVQAIIKPDLFRQHRQLIVTSPLLLIEGPLQIQDGTLSVKARHFKRIQGEGFITSHDFH
jgi:error-prone DNA polymerase